MRALAPAALGFALLLSCTPAKPEVDPPKVRAPAPPAPKPGGLDVYGEGLSDDRAAAVKQRLQSIGPDMLAEYRRTVAEDSSGLADGMLQLGIGIDRDGKVVEVKRVFSEVSDALALRLVHILEQTSFGPGPQAYAYYTLTFRRHPFEVLKISPDFEGDPPGIVAEVENRSGFELPAVSVTVSVLGPERAEPLRIYRRRLDVSFPPGERRSIRIPVGSEWASSRNTFLVELGPTGKDDPLQKGK